VERREEVTNALEHFEIIAQLYFDRFHDLAPGKDAPALMPNSLSREDNQARFKEWMKGDALNDAVNKISNMDAKLEEYNKRDERWKRAMREYASRIPWTEDVNWSEYMKILESCHSAMRNGDLDALEKVLGIEEK
jgi:anthranilate/para-aminobenzoate synthase component I